ncbi:condensin-2 complex subunit H2 [Xyrichtys novacula]|nr:condensin-2 complex subunit H2 [Xyrichtys novacula]
MCITFDGGKTRLNFAEAALLIQGSTCIYSKKVELLHNLVYQMLEYVNDRNKKRSKEAEGNPKDSTDSAAKNRDADKVAEFTPLDLNLTEGSRKANSRMKVNVTPLPPEALIALESHEKQKLPLFSVRGEILYSLKDFRSNIFIPGDDDMIHLTFRLSASNFLLENYQPPAETWNLLQEGQLAGEAAGEAADGLANVVENCADAADDFIPMEDLEQDAEEHLDRHQAPSEGRMIRERRELEDGKLQRKDAPPPPQVNVWALHDPYAELGGEKPFKSGKCYKVPDGLDDGGKRKRKRGAALQDFRSWLRDTFDPPEHKLKNGPTFSDLNYIYLNTMKDRLKSKRRILRKQGVVVSEEELMRTLLQPTETGPQQQGEGEHLEDFRLPDLLGGDEELSDNEQEAFPDDIPAEFGGADFIPPDVQKDELSYEDLVKLRVEQLVASCRGYTQETALSRRVQEWEEKIKPDLALQEERPAFDIHDYSDRIIRALDTIGQRRAFYSIVSGMENTEACKYLLASLQLANDYTVELDSAGGLEESLDTLGLTLLSTQKARDRFKHLDGVDM